MAAYCRACSRWSTCAGGSNFSDCLRICAASGCSTSARGTAGSASNASGAARDVVAVDCIALDTFLEAQELLGSKVEYLTLDVNELSARRLGKFDIVLFFGVLYHLRHPLLGLEKVVELVHRSGADRVVRDRTRKTGRSRR